MIGLFLFIFQETADVGFWTIFAKMQTYILIVVGFIVAYVLLRTGIPDRLALGWEKISGMQDKERAVDEREIKHLQDQKIKDDAEIARQIAQIVDLTREVDVRREINRQDSENCKGLKVDIIALEDTVARLRGQIREFGRGTENEK